MVRVIVDRCSVAQDDYGDWWLEFYVDDIRHAVLVSDVAAQHRVQADGGVCTCKKPIATTSTQNLCGNCGKTRRR